MAEPIRILIADDHEVVRQGLRLFLDLQDSLLVVGEARDEAEAAALAETGEPDVFVMDLSMPNMDGVEATRLVRRACPAAKVLVLSSFVDERLIPALRAGAHGYLTKDAGAEQLAEAIRAVHRGDPVFCPEAVRRVARQIVNASTRPTGTATVVFTDIVGSTEVLERLGEEDAQRLFRDHDALVRAGDVVAEDDRYFGRTIYLAARVSALAQGGEILVSDVTRALVGDLPEVRFADRGEHELEGLVGARRLWEVEWRM